MGVGSCQGAGACLCYDAMSLTAHRSDAYKPALHGFCVFALVWSVFLLYAGGFTTSIEAGMAFLDWPLSNGSVNPEGWLTDREMRAEHSHRLLGAKLGLLSIGLAVWMFLREARRSMRLLAGATLAMVVFQGLLGGMRVMLDRLNIGTESNVVAQSFAVAHACGAQIVVCLLVTLAMGTSRKWVERRGDLAAPVNQGLRRLGLVTCGAIFVQILIGAIMRHGNAGLAIPVFPHSTVEGGWLPAVWNWAVTLNFAHRIGAVAVSVLVVVFVAQIWKMANTRRAFGGLARVPLILLAGQIFLGATVVWTQINEHAATLHMLGGAFLLASCWSLTFLTFRLPLVSTRLEAESRDRPAESLETTPAEAKV